MKRKKLLSFSLVEVLIFVSIFNIFMVSAISINLFLLKNLKYQENKIKALFLAEQGLEWLRGEKERNWGGNIYPNGNNDTFSYKATMVNKTYPQPVCFNQLSWSAMVPQCSFNLENIFKRTINISYQSNPFLMISTEIKVQWIEFGETYEVKLNSIYNQWE